MKKSDDKATAALLPIIELAKHVEKLEARIAKLERKGKKKQ